MELISFASHGPVVMILMQWTWITWNKGLCTSALLFKKFRLIVTSNSFASSMYTYWLQWTKEKVIVCSVDAETLQVEKPLHPKKLLSRHVHVGKPVVIVFHNQSHCSFTCLPVSCLRRLRLTCKCSLSYDVFVRLSFAFSVYSKKNFWVHCPSSMGKPIVSVTNNEHGWRQADHCLFSLRTWEKTAIKICRINRYTFIPPSVHF